MARTDHSNTRRHTGRRDGLERQNRARLRQQITLGAYDDMTTRLPTRAMRTRVGE